MNRGPADSAGFVTVFSGVRAACHECALVQAAKGLAHELIEAAGRWLLDVPVDVAEPASDELQRYAAERRMLLRTPVPLFKPFGGAGFGALAYVDTLLLVAFIAGNRQFGADWLALISRAAAVV